MSDSSDSFDNSDLYEGLFLMSQSAIGGGIGAAIEHVRDILGRIDAQIITLGKWDDRKLAYPVKGQKRGLYLRSLFRADGTKLTESERACNLSELVLRAMVTRCDHMGQTEMDQELEEAKNSEAELKLREQEAERSAEPAEAKPAKATAEPAKDAAPAEPAKASDETAKVSAEPAAEPTAKAAE